MSHSFSYAVSMNLEHSIKEEAMKDIRIISNVLEIKKKKKKIP